jgi:hypothetical protein
VALGNSNTNLLDSQYWKEYEPVKQHDGKPIRASQDGTKLGLHKQPPEASDTFPDRQILAGTRTPQQEAFFFVRFGHGFFAGEKRTRRTEKKGKSTKKRSHKAARPRKSESRRRCDPPAFSLHTPRRRGDLGEYRCLRRKGQPWTITAGR